MNSGGGQSRRLFQLKQFSLYDDQSTMKIGTDAILLGAWTNISHATSVLDIGTGSGVIALMLAQRTSAAIHIDAIEPEPEDAAQALENVKRSPWPDRVSVHQTTLQDFASQIRYDLIVSNPPFFNNSQLPPSDKRKTARHTSTLPHDVLLACVDQLLAEGGLFSVILPVKEGTEFIFHAQFQNLYCKRQLAIYTREGKPQERWLLEFSRIPTTPSIERMTLYQEGQQRSKDYHQLTADFYL